MRDKEEKRDNTAESGSETVKREKKTDKVSAALYIAAVCLILIVVLRTFMAGSNVGYKTEQVRKVTMQDTEEITGFVVRDETYLTHEGGNVIVPLVRDGERVASGDVVARVFKSQEDAGKYSELESLNRKLEYYQHITEGDGSGSVDMEKLNGEISSAFSKTAENVARGKFTDAYDEISELKEKLTYKKMLLDSNTDFTEKAAGTEKEIAALKSQNLSAGEITAAVPGYYISSTDGYEKSFSYDKVNTIMVSDVKKLLETEKKEISANNGKIVGGYKWYILTTVDSKYAKLLSVGSNLKVNIKNYGRDGVRVKVEHISEAEDGKVALTLSCNLMDETFANVRTIEGELVVAEYTGLRVPCSALVTFDTTEDELERSSLASLREAYSIEVSENKRIDEEKEAKKAAKNGETTTVTTTTTTTKKTTTTTETTEPGTRWATISGGIRTEKFTGVYILRANYISVRRAEILYTGDDGYCVVRDRAKDSSNDGYYGPVQVYDEVIVKGRGLRNGRISY